MLGLTVDVANSVLHDEEDKTDIEVDFIVLTLRSYKKHSATSEASKIFSVCRNIIQ